MSHDHKPATCPECDGDGEVSADGEMLASGHYAWCVACHGTGLADCACEGCGKPTALDTLDRVPLECADIVVHADCDTGSRFFDSRPAPRMWSDPMWSAS